ncbi:MAG TPA: serine/threonine protein kinase [Desulfobulbus sp.]|nr:serine/threonine protein kinase [Desulfobulbus sp.]
MPDLSDLPAEIRERLRDHRVTRSLRRKSRVYSDTTDFTSIDYGDIILVDGRYFLVTGYTREGRFGVDDQIKPWVPRVEDLTTGAKQILKLEFHETFDIKMGPFSIHCYRNPEKEARILELVRGQAHFMQGEAVLDEAGNLVRVLDIINGSRLDKVIHRSKITHEEYFHNELPHILEQYLPCVEAIGFLHQHGFRHGDVRRDHIFVERKTGLYRWIDFDYDFYMPEKPFALDLYELGNALMYLTGRGNFYVRDILSDPSMGQPVADTITAGDFSLLSKNRIVNLQKIFPYIPTALNNIFLHFSLGTEVFYDTVQELYDDLAEVVRRGW